MLFLKRRVLMRILPIILFSLFVFTESSGMQLSIDEAVDYAMKNNLDLKAKREELNIAKGNLTAALNYPFNPEISLEGRSLNSTGDDVKTRYRFGEKNEYTIYLSQTFETGGQRSLRKDIALKNEDVVQFEIADMERLLTGEAKREFYNLIFLEDKFKLTDLSIGLNQKLLDVAEKRFRSGDAPKMDVNLTMVELKKVENEKIKVTGLLSISKARLGNLLGLPPDTEIILKRDDDITPPLKDMDLKGLKEKAISEEISLTRADVSPDVRVSLLYNRDYDKELYGAGVSIPIPIVNKNRGQIETLMAQKLRLNTMRESLKLLIEKEIESAWMRVDTAKKSLKLFKEDILPQLKENADGLKRAYDAGRVGIFAIIIEHQKLISNTSAYYDSLFEYNTALVDLETAIAGGRK